MGAAEDAKAASTADIDFGDILEKSFLAIKPGDFSLELSGTLSTKPLVAGTRPYFGAANSKIYNAKEMLVRKTDPLGNTAGFMLGTGLSDPFVAGLSCALLRGDIKLGS